MRDVCLGTFLNTHFQVDGVTNYIDLRRIKLVEEVSVVPVQVTYGIIIVLQAFVHELLVIYVALLHAKHGLQDVCLIYGITNPCDITEIVFLSF